MTDLKRAFRMQRNGAKERGIAFEFSFEEWLSVWEKSGKLSERGRGSGRYVMARIGDIGPYKASNVEIITGNKNSIDARKNSPKSLSELRSRQIGTGRGWSRYFNKYAVSVSRKYIGLFSTAEEAEAAYKSASARLMSEASHGRTAGNNPDVPGSGRD